MKLAVFIDYDNLLENQRISGILSVATRALMRTPLKSTEPRGTCDIRVYGGWYEGPTMTQRAQQLSVSISSEFPAIIRVNRHDGGVSSLAANAELAVSMMEDPGHHLFDTYRRKGKPNNLKIHDPATVGCANPSCLLPPLKKLLKTGRCPISNCSVAADDLVYRHEQKIVDTLLTCDMLYAPTLNYVHLVLVSGDDDFLPPIRTVMLRGTSVARFHPKPSQFRNPLAIRGTTLTETNL